MFCLHFFRFSPIKVTLLPSHQFGLCVFFFFVFCLCVSTRTGSEGLSRRPALLLGLQEATDGGHFNPFARNAPQLQTVWSFRRYFLLLNANQQRFSLLFFFVLQSLRCSPCSSSPSMPPPTTRNQSPSHASPPDLPTPWSHGTGTFFSPSTFINPAYYYFRHLHTSQSWLSQILKVENF